MGGGGGGGGGGFYIVAPRGRKSGAKAPRFNDLKFNDIPKLQTDTTIKENVKNSI